MNILQLICFATALRCALDVDGSTVMRKESIVVISEGAAMRSFYGRAVEQDTIEQEAFAVWPDVYMRKHHCELAANIDSYNSGSLDACHNKCEENAECNFLCFAAESAWCMTFKTCDAPVDSPVYIAYMMSPLQEVRVSGSPHGDNEKICGIDIQLGVVNSSDCDPFFGHQERVMNKKSVHACSWQD